ncbi:MAG: hypothetical protein AAGA21_01540 [Pseudomonadota bacterium]
MMKPKPRKRSAQARALASNLFRQRKRPSKKLYRRRARTKNAGLRDQAGGSFCKEGSSFRLTSDDQRSIVATPRSTALTGYHQHIEKLDIEKLGASDRN